MLATGLLLIVLVLMALNVMLQRRLARRDAARTSPDRSNSGAFEPI